MASIPIYVGADEVQGIFLGSDEVQEMYLGTDLVYQSGPFSGLKLSPKTVSFAASTSASTIKITASEEWSLTTPEWVSPDISTGDTGETIVTLTATPQSATTSGTIEVTSLSYVASATVRFNTYTPLNYVETDGACWYDTGLIPDDSTTFEIVEFTPLAKAHNWQVYIGRSKTDMDENTCMVFKANQYGTAYESKFGSCERVGSPSYTTGVTVNIKYAQSGLSVDNVFWSFSERAGLQIADPHTIWIGAENNNNTGGDWNVHRGSKARFGEIKFWTQGNLVADLVPAEYEGQIGFWDSVSGAFRPNLGTGTPIGG